MIGGRYQVIASLGKGGMGLVYKAYDPVLDRTVALKKMIATVVDSEEGRQRFYIEARAAARLNHPNIVTIHELEEYSGDIYIVMELLDGVSLAAFMRQRVHMPLAGYLTIIAQIADGLHYAHKRAIVHRDIKPPNLVLTTDRQPQDPRLRHRAARLERNHEEREAARHAALHGARAGEGTGGRRARRSVFARRGRLRARDGHQAVRGRFDCPRC